MSVSFIRQGDKMYKRIINWIEGWSVVIPVDYTEDAEVLDITDWE